MTGSDVNQAAPCPPLTQRGRIVGAMPSNARTKATPVETQPVEIDEPVDEKIVEPEIPWVVIVWNDPINLMSYVVFVFQKLFGYPRDKATQLMLDVHHKGKAAVSHGTREKCEFDVSRLHAHGLWATMQTDR
jgi:ATP-dependent Clp protease adaptor protein ClpS